MKNISKENYILKLMYDFVSTFDKELKKTYKSIPKDRRKVFTYEQFIVAQFSNIIEDERGPDSQTSH